MIVVSYHNTHKKTTKIATLADRSPQHNERQTAMQFSHLAIAALAAMSMIGAAAGADDITTSHRASVVIPSDATVGDGVPATVPATATAATTAAATTATATTAAATTATATTAAATTATVPATAPRKLMKHSKASNSSNANALSPEVDRLLGNIVFKKAMELYRFVQPSSDDTARAGGSLYFAISIAMAIAIVGEAMIESNEEICELCLNFLWDAQYATENNLDAYCQNVVLSITDNVDPPISDDYEKSMMTSCMAFSQCPSQNTNLACCQSQRACIGYELPPVCSATTKYEQYGCTSYYNTGYAYRPPNIKYDSFTAETCSEACKDKGFKYFGFECPMTDQVHCQCYKADTIGEKPVEEAICKERVGKDGDKHCTGPAMMDGLSLGGANMGSIYKVGAIDDEKDTTAASKQTDPNYCKLSCDSGSCENYSIQTETKAECDTDSMALGCGACKDKGPSDAILQQARMPMDGFVSLCAGGIQAPDCVDQRAC